MCVAEPFFQQTNEIYESPEKKTLAERCRQFTILAHARISLIIYHIFIQEIFTEHIT